MMSFLWRYVIENVIDEKPQTLVRVNVKETFFPHPLLDVDLTRK